MKKKRKLGGLQLTKNSRFFIGQMLPGKERSIYFSCWTPLSVWNMISPPLVSGFYLVEASVYVFTKGFQEVS